MSLLIVSFCSVSTKDSASLSFSLLLVKFSENKNNKLELVDVNIILPPLDEWQDPKIWGQMVMTETTQWNTYCNKSILIDVNSDGLMDALCSNVAQDFKSANLFLLNKGNMQFDVLNPNQVDKWVDWLE